MVRRQGLPHECRLRVIIHPAATRDRRRNGAISRHRLAPRRARFSQPQFTDKRISASPRTWEMVANAPVPSRSRFTRLWRPVYSRAAREDRMDDADTLIVGGGSA